MKVTVFTFLTFLCVLFFTGPVSLSQEPPVQDGIKSYETGDFAAAVQKLENTNESVGLRFLGLSYDAVGKKKEAAKSFERSLKNGYSAFESSFVKWREDKGKSSFAMVLRDLSEVLSASVASAENAVQLKADITNDNEWLLKANVLKNLRLVEKTGIEFYRFDEVDSEVKMLDRPRPKISASSCVERLGLDTTIVLDILFYPDGQTLLVIPVSKWNKACSVPTVMAAMSTRFEPAIKNGKPVGAVKRIQHKFSWY